MARTHPDVAFRLTNLAQLLAATQRRLVEADPDSGCVRAVAGLVDRQRAAHQRFRLAEPVAWLAATLRGC